MPSAQDNSGPVIVRVSGPIVGATGMRGAEMYEVVEVGEMGLVGEVVRIVEDRATIQVYEDTSMVKPGAPVRRTHAPLSVSLGPGLIGNIYDGIQRPLPAIQAHSGAWINRGEKVPALDVARPWPFEPRAAAGRRVAEGEVLGVVAETPLVEHRVLVPPGVAGTLQWIAGKGEYTLVDKIAVIETAAGARDVTMLQPWPVRVPRPIRQRLRVMEPLITGQRIIDTFFPIGKGGTAAIPGGFGTGKTITQHQLAKWSDADIIVYIGCGERGNEMTDVLREFPELKDPHSGQPLMKRVVLLANTSDMPVAAREASVYTGITIAEYYRDMGYSVALMADSTSRWAEAMREISTRLEEMPAEEGYPAYLGARIASFYERSGRVACLGSPDREGALSIIGAVSPPGGDLSDSVVQATLHVVKVFWSLQGRLAQQRHFPAIDWLTSYSFYKQYLSDCFDDKARGVEFAKMVQQAMNLLEQEAQLVEIVRLVGAEAISATDRMALETSKSIREDFLHQNAFHAVDTYTPIDKQYDMMSLILHFHSRGLEAIENGVEPAELFKLTVREDIARAKYIDYAEKEKITSIRNKIDQQVRGLYAGTESEQKEQPETAETSAGGANEQ